MRCDDAMVSCPIEPLLGPRYTDATAESPQIQWLEEEMRRFNREETPFLVAPAMQNPSKTTRFHHFSQLFGARKVEIAGVSGAHACALGAFLERAPRRERDGHAAAQDFGRAAVGWAAPRFLLPYKAYIIPIIACPSLGANISKPMLFMISN